MSEKGEGRKIKKGRRSKNKEAEWQINEVNDRTREVGTESQKEGDLKSEAQKR